MDQQTPDGAEGNGFTLLYGVEFWSLVRRRGEPAALSYHQLRSLALGL